MKSQGRPYQGSRGHCAAASLTEQAPQKSRGSSDIQAPPQHDIGDQTAPSEAAPKKRPLPHSFKPAKRSAFVPPRGRVHGTQSGSHAARPSPPVSAQPASSNRPWPLSLHTNNKQKPACLPHAVKQTPQGSTDPHQWTAPSPGSAAAGQGKQRRLPILAPRAGPSASSGVAHGHAVDELHFPAAQAQQPVRLCIVPDAISGGAAEYASVWLPAVFEELNLQ